MTEIDEEKISPEVEESYSVNLDNNDFTAETKSDPGDKIQVEIGDTKQPDFKPQFKMLRWDNEVNFSMRGEEKVGATFDSTGDVIKYVTPDYEIHMYDKPELGDDGGFEFEWLLKNVPSTNILTATLQTKGLDFFYQAELTQEEIDEGVTRPDNVIGSYAVYHKTKKNNRVGGKEYKTGKFAHIYRPKAKDANNQEVWCDIFIDESNQLLTVTIPQDFVDNALYPIIVDPTFGKTTAGASRNNLQTNSIEASHYTLSDSGAVVTKISSYVDSNGNTGRNMKGVIYSDSAAKPLTLQANSAGVATPLTQTLVDYSLSVTLNAAEFWLGVDSDQVNNGMYFDAGAANSAYFFTAAGTYATPPTTWTDFSSSRTRQQSTYATYTTGITFDAASNSGEQLAQSSYNWNHTCTGTDRYLIVGIGMFSLAQTVSSITYNSVALTFLGAQNSVTGAARVELWGLVAPSTGSNSIAVTLTGAINSGGVAESYTTVHQTFSTEGFNSAQATNVGVADATVNVTTVADNDWVVDIVATDDTTIAVGAGQTQRNNISGTVGAVGNSDEGPKTPAGSVTMSWTNIGALATWSIGAIALRPTSASGLTSTVFNGNQMFQLTGVGT